VARVDVFSGLFDGPGTFVMRDADIVRVLAISGSLGGASSNTAVIDAAFVWRRSESTRRLTAASRTFHR
jgi:hypothetical protein